MNLRKLSSRDPAALFERALFTETVEEKFENEKFAVAEETGMAGIDLFSISEWKPCIDKPLWDRATGSHIFTGGEKGESLKDKKVKQENRELWGDDSYV